MGPVKVSILSHRKNKHKGTTGHFANDSQVLHTGETQVLSQKILVILVDLKLETAAQKQVKIIAPVTMAISCAPQRFRGFSTRFSRVSCCIASFQLLVGL